MAFRGQWRTVSSIRNQPPPARPPAGPHAEVLAVKPRLAPLRVVKSCFTIADNTRQFFTNGRAIFGFGEHLTAKIAVLDTFFAMEMTLKCTNSNALTTDRLLEVLQVEEDANLQQATLLLVVSNRYNQPRLCVLDVDFAANSFRIARTFELSLAQPGDHVREARVRRFGGLLNLSFAPLVNRAILRTAEPTRFLVVVGDSMGPAAFFFDLTTGTVEAIRHGEPLARGRFVGFQFFENQLVCVEQIVRLDAPRRLAVRVVLADLETGNTRLIPAERWFFAATDWRIESMCVKDDCLYVLAKKPHSEEAIRAFGVRLPDGFWKAVKCGQFAPFAFEHAVSAFQADFWTVHCRRTAIVGGHSAPEFHSFRIPMARLESLLWRSWFSLLNGPSIRAVVPNAFVSRLLSRTGLYTDRVAFEPPRTFIIREDVDLAEAARPAAAVGQNRFQTGGEAAEQADLEAAIQQSPLPSTGETSQTSAKKEAEQINADGDHAMDFSDPENEAMDDEMADA